MHLKRKNAVTLVELLIAVFILTAGIAGTLLLYVNSLLASELAWDMTVATTHAEHLLEEMQQRPTSQEILNQDWEQWARQEGLITLPNEKVSVDFSDPGDNPLDIHVSINWERKKIPNRIVLRTKLLK